MDERSSRPAVFLDRDGVVNEDSAYVGRKEDFHFLPGVAEAIRLLNEAGYWVFVVTNQSGIARGMFTEDDFHDLSDWMLAELASHGAKIDHVFYCPHHETEGVGKYRVDCDCRKPKPGMIIDAMRQYPVIKEESFMVGDMHRDLEAAAAAGIKGYLVDGAGLLGVVRRVLAK
jgi:D-glycero-D-manno-heptose 1,7-bisphosphate phosphatase